jgi:hypothetical protein
VNLLESVGLDDASLKFHATNFFTVAVPFCCPVGHRGYSCLAEAYYLATYREGNPFHACPYARLQPRARRQSSHICADTVEGSQRFLTSAASMWREHRHMTPSPAALSAMRWSSRCNNEEKNTSSEGFLF